MTDGAVAWSQLALVLGLDETAAIDIANAADARPSDVSAFDDGDPEVPRLVAADRAERTPAAILTERLGAAGFLVRIAHDAQPSHIARAFESTAPMREWSAELVLRDGLGCDENLLFAARQLTHLGLDVLVDESDDETHALVVVPRKRLAMIAAATTALRSALGAPPPVTHAPPAGAGPSPGVVPTLPRLIDATAARTGEAHPVIHGRTRPVMADEFLERTRDGRGFAVCDEGTDAWIALALELGLDDAAARDVGIAYADPEVYLDTHRGRLASAFPRITSPAGVTPLLALFDRLHVAGLAAGITSAMPPAHVAATIGALRPVYGGGTVLRLDGARSIEAALRAAGDQLARAGLELVSITLDSGAYQLAVIPADRLRGVLSAALDAHPFVAPILPGVVLDTTVPVVRYLDFSAEDGVHDGGPTGPGTGGRFSGAWTRFRGPSPQPTPPRQPPDASLRTGVHPHTGGPLPTGTHTHISGPLPTGTHVRAGNAVRDDGARGGPVDPSDRSREERTPAPTARAEPVRQSPPPAPRATDARGAWTALALALGLPRGVAEEVGSSVDQPGAYFDAHRDGLMWQFGSIDEVSKLTPVLALCDALQRNGLHAGVDARFAAADVAAALEHAGPLRDAGARLRLRLPDGWTNDDALLLAAARLTRWGLELLLVTVTPDGFEFAIVPRARLDAALEAAAVVRSFTPDASHPQLPVVRYVDFDPDATSDATARPPA
ncbi:hypothetical protein F8O01_16185 [Pseudoclavibacter chungangensis]|uniref:DUF6630 domain-containing protein n=1 Tax=Pseudoclavibacter chungangensis TaxID=587635 RepID=A0A7J5BMG5_9MICO|nr:hypothetical protein [Pseudoclavibacter chungangensis]KAB1652723.1 hypothetical protein F8O01_16185 [Pseudoclavibacter chungangensis]NYJ67998.1 hypothetical protein [Pseudoclavibacter chungangensis]